MEKEITRLAGEQGIPNYPDFDENSPLNAASPTDFDVAIDFRYHLR